MTGYVKGVIDSLYKTKSELKEGFNDCKGTTRKIFIYSQGQTSVYIAELLGSILLYTSTEPLHIKLLFGFPMTLDFAARSLTAFASLYKNGDIELEGIIGKCRRHQTCESFSNLLF